MIRRLFPSLLTCSLLVLSLLVGAGCSPSKVPIDGLSKLQGDWVVIELNEMGNPANTRRLKNLSLSIRGNQYHRVEADGPKLINSEQTSIRVDASKTPFEIDFIGTQGADQGKTRKGICLLEDSKLKICSSEFNTPRPTDFVAKDKITLIVLERKQ